MSDHDALLQAIGDYPEEDTPRLMYADWLEENGEPERADFVRTQVELARPGLAAADRYPFVRKNVYYLTNFARRWKSELPDLDGITWGDFNRGLIEEVLVAGERPLVEHAEPIFAVPGVHVLRLKRLRDATEVTQLPQLERLRALKMVSAGAHRDELRVLLASPYLGRLQVLDLHGNGADDAVVADIADGRFPDLTELWLGANPFGQAGALTLAHSPHLDKLRVLHLTGSALNSTRSALVQRFGSALKV
jgi:uncharacterized protein (TIGR02996 family)